MSDDKFDISYAYHLLTTDRGLSKRSQLGCRSYIGADINNHIEKSGKQIDVKKQFKELSTLAD